VEVLQWPYQVRPVPGAEVHGRAPAPAAALAGRPAAGWLLYWLAWPGMELAPFAGRRPGPLSPAARGWLARGLAGTAAGLGGVALLSTFADRLGGEVLGWPASPPCWPRSTWAGRWC
jgi:hypothetical protein